jgi:hypothetical protein
VKEQLLGDLANNGFSEEAWRQIGGVGTPCG